MFYITLSKPFCYFLLTLDQNKKVVSAVFSDTSSGEELSCCALKEQLYAYFTGTLENIDTFIEYPTTLSLFALSVLCAIKDIPYGKVMTYQEIAEKIGKPKAARAVGLVCSKNPLALFVPCHRVVRAHNEAFSYAWGKDRKKALLALEKSLHLL